MTINALLASILAIAVLSASCSERVGPQGEEDSHLRERAQTDLIFARTAMELLAEPAVAEIELYRRTGRFSATVAGSAIDVKVCGGGRVVVLDETTPHGQTFAVKLVALPSGAVVVSYYDGEVPRCDSRTGPPAWPWGCVVDAAASERLRCTEFPDP